MVLNRISWAAFGLIAVGMLGGCGEQTSLEARRAYYEARVENVFPGIYLREAGEDEKRLVNADSTSPTGIQRVIMVYRLNEDYRKAQRDRGFPSETYRDAEIMWQLKEPVNGTANLVVRIFDDATSHLLISSEVRDERYELEEVREAWLPLAEAWVDEIRELGAGFD